MIFLGIAITGIALGFLVGLNQKPYRAYAIVFHDPFPIRLYKRLRRRPLNYTIVAPIWQPLWPSSPVERDSPNSNTE